MAAALAYDPSVITGVDQAPVDLQPVGNPMSTAPMTTPTLVAPVEPTLPAAATETTTPAVAAPTIDLNQLPKIQDMVNELRASGILTAQTTLPPSAATDSATETQVFPAPGADPTQSILLANTAPTYQRPTAANLLSGVANAPHASRFKWFLPITFVCLLGAAGIMMYIQMRSSGTIQLP